MTALAQLLETQGRQLIEASIAIRNDQKPPATQPAASVAPMGISADGLTVKLNDDFSDPVKSWQIWRKGRPANAAGGHHGYNWSDKDPNDRERGFYLSDNDTIENGRMVLTAKREPLTVVLDKARQGQRIGNTFYSPEENGQFEFTTGTVGTGPDLNGWISAMATAGKTWTKLPASVVFNPGDIIEICAKLPKGQGMWPALWLLPVAGGWGFETDILEQVDPTGRRIAQHLHANNGAIDLTNWPGLGVDTGVDLSLDFHVFGLSWKKDALTWLIDGKVTQTITQNIPNVPMYLIINLAVGGKWPGVPDASTPFPARMEIDYVRAWSR